MYNTQQQMHYIMLYNFSHNYLANSIKHEWQIGPMTTLKESREQCLPHLHVHLPTKGTHGGSIDLSFSL